MNFAEVKPLINFVIGRTMNYESGDLMAIPELSNAYKKISKYLAEDPSYEKGFNLLQTIANSVELLSDDKKEKEVLKLLKSVNEVLNMLNQNEPDAGSFITSLENLILNPSKANEHVSNDTQMKEVVVNENATKKETGYTDGYFDGIIDDKNMLLQLNEEIKEHLDNAQFTLIDLENDPEDAEKINKVFRSFHTIKGSSAFLGLKNFEEVGHKMEDLLMLIRDGKMKIEKKIIDVIFVGIDLLRKLSKIMEEQDYNVSQLKEEFLKVDIFTYIELLKKILSQYQQKSIESILEEAGFIKEKKSVETKPSVEAKEKVVEKEKIDEKLIIPAKKEVEEGNIKKEEVITKEEKKVEINREVIKEEKPIEKVKKVEEVKPSQPASAKRINFVKVSYERLNNLIDIVGELVISQSMLKQMILTNQSQEDTEKIISQLESISSNIKNLVLSMGMVPISDLFNKLRVAIRNTAEETGKQVNIVIHGEDTELDRNVMEVIYDPLMHMVRNAVDHGIETPLEREKKGKDITGTVTITAEHKGNGIEITVMDDGKGIDKERIIQKAISKGLITEDESFNLTDKQIYNFMFLPGFSTAAKVTEISGRGVGLDVVKKNIESIHGKVDIISEKDKYTKFIIKLPLTLAIIEGFITEIGVNKYVFPFNSVEEIIVPDPKNINKMDDGNLMLFNRGVYIPIIYSGRVLRESTANESIENMLLIVIRYEENVYALIVDKVLGKQEVVIKNLSEVLNNLRLFSGGTIFGDGTIGFVIDIEGFIETAKKLM